MKMWVVGLLVILLVSAGVVIYLNQTSNSSSLVQQESLTQGNTATTSSDTVSQTSPNLGGNYITGWGADAYKNSTSEKTVLFFYADWCPTCRPVDAEFKQNVQKIPAGIEIYRVNYNDSETDEAEKALAQKYGVTYQHTFVQIDKDGNEITKWNGGGLDKLISSIK